MVSNSSTAGVVLLYLVCLLLPQMIWLLQSNSGFAVCESCGRDGDTRTFVEVFMSRRNSSTQTYNTWTEPPTICDVDPELTESRDKSESGGKESDEWEYSSLCSCALDQEDIIIDNSDPEGGWYVCQSHAFNISTQEFPLIYSCVCLLLLGQHQMVSLTCLVLAPSRGWMCLHSHRGSLSSGMFHWAVVEPIVVGVHITSHTTHLKYANSRFTL